MILPDLIGFAVASAIMVKSGAIAVNAITHIGKNLNIGHFMLSFLIVGLVNAMPESLVSVISAAEGVPHLGFGVLIGSVIVDLTLVIGLVALSAGSIRITRGFTYELWLFALLSLLTALALDGTLSRIEGAIMIGGCALFFYTLLKENHIVDKLVHSDKRHMAKQLLIFAASTAAVFVSANYVVKYSESIAADVGMPLVLVGLVLIAITTSLPEAIFAITAARKKLGDLAIGELFGVIMIDGAFLTGLIAIIHPITIPPAEMAKLAIFYLTAVAIATYFVRSNRTLTWKDGIFMVMLYLLFIITELTTASMSA